MAPKRKKTTPNIMSRDKKTSWKRKTAPSPSPSPSPSSSPSPSPPSSPESPPPLALAVEEEQDGVVACLNVIDDMPHLEETEDGVNPDEAVPPPPPPPPPPAPRPVLPDLNGPPPDEPPPTFPNDQNDDVDLTVTAENGQVASIYYPHPRHQCIEFPFKTTPHKEHCEMCYCFICELAAPCSFWTNECNSHCDAEDAGHWKIQREFKRKFNNMKNNKKMKK